jgi:TonB-dependent starch-binding outer membrane protein SusC
MAMVRHFLICLIGTLLCALPLSAQTPTGTISGRVLERATQRPLAGVAVAVDGASNVAVTNAEGRFTLTNVQAGARRVTAGLIGYATLQQDVTVIAGATANIEFALESQALALDALIVTGYGTQRRLSITGSVATVDADAANVGVISDANDLIQGRVAGVHITQNNGEPGAGAQVRIRGGTSISASNEPLYVIDGMPIANVPTEARGIGINSDPPLSRSPLGLLNPSDIESITILKDAAATAIYGSRAANGVILIQTKQGTPGRVSIEYDGYLASARSARSLDLMTGAQYRQFVQELVAGGETRLTERLASLGPDDTNWENELLRTGVTHNHNLSFAGGGQDTRYRASLNYMNQEGVVLSNGLERLQGRLNATHSALRRAPATRPQPDRLAGRKRLPALREYRRLRGRRLHEHGDLRPDAAGHGNRPGARASWSSTSAVPAARSCVTPSPWPRRSRTSAVPPARSATPRRPSI